MLCLIVFSSSEIVAFVYLLWRISWFLCSIEFLKKRTKFNIILKLLMFLLKSCVLSTDLHTNIVLSISRCFDYKPKNYSDVISVLFIYIRNSRFPFQNVLRIACVCRSRAVCDQVQNECSDCIVPFLRGAWTMSNIFHIHSARYKNHRSSQSQRWPRKSMSRL